MRPRRSGRIVLWIALAVLLGGARGTLGQNRAGAPVEFISAEQVLALRAAGRLVLLVDVRARGEYDAIHIDGAVSLPLGELERRHQEIPREVPVVLY